MSISSHDPIYKTPNEKYTFTIDFTGRLPTGATLSSVVATAKEQDTEESATSEILQTTAAAVDSGTNILSVNLKDGGIADKTYLVRCVVTLSSGAKLEENLTVKVVDYYR